MTKSFIKSVLILFALTSGTLASADGGTDLHLRTGLVGRTIVGASADGKFYAIVCYQGIVLKSTADLVFPNINGDVVLKDYAVTSTRVSNAAEAHSPYFPLSIDAVTQVCNHPNGAYNFRISADGTSIEFLGGQSFDADSGRFPRRF